MYSKKNIVEDLLQCEEKYGYVKATVLNNDDNFCSVGPVKKEFGSLQKAREELNLTQVPKNPCNFENDFGYLNVICDGYERNAEAYIYCIEFNESIYYIGQSEQLRKRISKHYTESGIRSNKRPPEVYQKHDKLNMTDIVEVRSFYTENIDDEERKMFYDIARRFDTQEIYGRR